MNRHIHKCVEMDDTASITLQFDPRNRPATEPDRTHPRVLERKKSEKYEIERERERARETDRKR